MKFGIKRTAVCSILGYILLLILLTLAEGTSPDSSISSFTDALWYSVVTLSTVGYGDMYPVTLLGRIIGACFVFMSLGVLSFIMGIIITFLTQHLLPAIKLAAVRNQNWYVFDQANVVSLALAADLERTDPDAVFLFPLSQSASMEQKPSFRFYPETMAQAVKGKEDNCSLFFLSPDGNNYLPALEALELGHPVYCRSQQVPADCPKQLTLFNRYTCCAREYWRTLALGSQEQTVVILGSGQYAHRLLEQGLMVNVFGQNRHIAYHAFGDWTNFRKNHAKLNTTISVDGMDSEQDCLFFHEESWNIDSALLCSADRIILCSDDESENLSVLHQLRRFFPIKGAVHLRATAQIPGETVFGINEKIYTADLVMGTQLTETARLMHRIYADSADYEVPLWEQLSDFLQQSNIAAADHLLTKVRLLLKDDSITALSKAVCTKAYQIYTDTREQRAEEYRETEHLRWMRFHSLYNWDYAPVRDNTARLHPLMQPYHMLPRSEQLKDDYAWELIGKLAEKL